MASLSGVGPGPAGRGHPAHCRHQGQQGQHDEQLSSGHPIGIPAGPGFMVTSESTLRSSPVIYSLVTRRFSPARPEVTRVGTAAARRTPGSEVAATYHDQMFAVNTVMAL